MPLLLASSLGLLLLFGMWCIKQWSYSIPIRGGISVSASLIIGCLCGVVLAIAYISIISPLHVWLQQHVGDYVRSGETTQAFQSSLGLFFIGNVILAPLAEELIYRGLLFEAACSSMGAVAAAALTCAAFGLLHWFGGIWYILITGLFAGVVFIVLRIWSGGLLAPYSAHVVLNLIEFIWIAKLARPDV